jgi:insertion element IS1 protein InsB
MMGKLFGRNRSLIYRWIRDAGLNTDEPAIDGEITQIEFDEMWHFILSKKKKLRLIKALDRGSRRTIARVLGGRDSATFKRLYDKVIHLKNCTFYTDNWNAFADVLPPELHIIGKNGTHTVERDNSNTRHHLGRFTRRIMVDLSIRLWCALTKPEIFKLWQSQMMYIFR